MNTEEPNYDTQQQADMRGLLEQIKGYFKASSDLYKESEVLVGPTVASIIVPVGQRPPEANADNMEGQRRLHDYGKRVADTKFVAQNFYRDELIIGSPIIQAIEEGEENLILRYKLVPNDIIQAEKDVARTIRRFNERKA